MSEDYTAVDAAYDWGEVRATQAERKRCVSVLVRRALFAKQVGWTYRRNHGACWGWSEARSETKYLMQAAREIMPKKGN